MPLYDLECPECKEISEVSIPLTILDIEGDGAFQYKCPKCDTVLTSKNRLLPRTSFILKGGGWADDGYSKGVKNE